MPYKYSIIIPHYNSPKLLRKLIESIPIRNDIEIIIIDDNSDEQLDLSVFLNENISFFTNFTGVQSAGACRNIGLKNAKGKWLLFADSDDFFSTDAFKVLDENAKGKFDVVYFSPTSIELKTGVISDRHHHCKTLVNRFICSNDQLIKYSYHVPWSKLVSRKLVNKHSILFDETITANDVVFSLLVGIYAREINAVDDVVYCATKSAGSLNSLKSIEAIRSRYQVMVKRNNILLEHNLKQYQHSFYSLIKDYHKGVTLSDFFTLLGNLMNGKLMFLPREYKRYFKEPRLLYFKLFKKT